MNETDLSSLSDQQLYERFVELEIRMGEVYYRLRTYKRLMTEWLKFRAEIESRQPAIASVFRAGLKHDDPWVRLGVVKFCIHAARDEALAVLKEVSGLEYHPARVNAGIAYDFYTKGDIIGGETRRLVGKILDRAEASGVRLRDK